ncbi:uncharacterized protein LOC117204533 [Bombus bifarius]|uniref:Uncharacterized protein LOC117204533 n=1 Tax=Bombus bifarius TaxID=103933 RepID=A0A6P8LCU6_9HYME|nr:uncharacterized protein LOC117204533 [Bombus bifarius]
MNVSGKRLHNNTEIRNYKITEDIITVTNPDHVPVKSALTSDHTVPRDFIKTSSGSGSNHYSETSDVRRVTFEEAHPIGKGTQPRSLPPQLDSHQRNEFHNLTIQPNEWPSGRNKAFLTKHTRDLTPHDSKSALQGEAADCLNALPLSNVNYSQAIAVLKESFECPRYTAFSHCMAIIDYPKITKESPTELRRLVHTFKQHIYALNKLGDSYPDTSAVLTSLILSKIPLSIQKQWEMTLPNNEVPPYIHLLNFLERLARSSRPITTVRQTRESPEQTTPVRQRASRGHALTATQVNPTCPTCQGPHPIWKCDTFKTKSLRERIREVKRASLCVNCLGKGHTTRHCFAGSCRVCGERHHTMLHRTKRHSGSRSSTSSPKSSPSNSRSTTPSLPPYVSPTRCKRHTTDHRSETPRTAASPSPPPIDKRTHNQ